MKQGIHRISLEGYLLKPSDLAKATLYIAANSYRFRERISRTGKTLLLAPFRGAFKASILKGISEDRLAVLGQEYFDDVLKGLLHAPRVAEITRLQKRGTQIHLTSSHIEEVVRPIARYLHIQEYQCSWLEYVDGVATGQLISPQNHLDLNFKGQTWTTSRF